MAAAATKTKNAAPTYAAATMVRPRLADRFKFNNGDYTKLADVAGRDLTLYGVEYDANGKFGPCVTLKCLEDLPNDETMIHSIITSSQCLVPYFQQVIEAIETGELSLDEGIPVRFILANNPRTGNDYWTVE